MTIRRSVLAIALAIGSIVPVALPSNALAEDASAAVRKVTIGVPDMH